MVALPDLLGAVAERCRASGGTRVTRVFVDDVAAACDRAAAAASFQAKAPNWPDRPGWSPRRAARSTRRAGAGIEHPLQHPAYRVQTRCLL